MAHTQQERVSRINEALLALARASSAEEIVSVLRSGTPYSRELAGVTVALLQEDGRWFRLYREGFGNKFDSSYPKSTIDDPYPGPWTVRNRQPLWFESVAELRAFSRESAEHVSPHEVGSWAVLPLTSGAAALGYIIYHFYGHRSFDDEERNLMRAVIATSGHLLANIALRDSDEKDRHQDRLLRSFTDELARCHTPMDVADAAIHITRDELKADAVAIHQLKDDRLVLIGQSGFSDEYSERYRSVGMNADVAVVRAVSRVEPCQVEDADELAMLVSPDHEEKTFQTILEFPLAYGGRTIGAITTMFRQPRTLSENDIAFLGAVMDRVALAIERAEAFERERLARLEAENRSRNLSHVMAITDAAIGAVSLGSLAPDLLERMRRATGADDASLWLVGRSGHELVEFGRADEDRRQPIPLTEGLTGHIARKMDTLIVDDLDQWPTYRPWMGSDEKSLVGAPIKRGERVMGVLKVVSKQPANFNSDDAAVVQLVAGRMASAIERARLYEERERMSLTLQRTLMPSQLPRIPDLEIACLYEPYTIGDEMGGDFYDAFTLPGGQAWGLAIGDVCGKGPEAAAVMAKVKQSVRALMHAQNRPAEALEMVNELLLKDTSAEHRFVTVCVCRVRPMADHTRLTVCLAGHPQPLLVTQDGDVKPIGRYGDLLGIIPDIQLHEVVLDLDPGQTLVFYTDGLIEPLKGQEPDSLEKLSRVLKDAASLDSAADILEMIKRTMLTDRTTRRDDTALIVIKRLPIPA